MKPKNFTEALDEIEKMSESVEPDLRARLFKELRALEEKFEAMKPQLDELKHKAKAGKDQVETQVKENPWLALGLVGAICFVLGFLFSGRRRD